MNFVASITFVRLRVELYLFFVFTRKVSQKCETLAIKSRDKSTVRK